MQVKTLVVALALAGLVSAASADDLADGIKAWEGQDFTRAHQLLGKLAQAGNPEAQLLIGEMYGFGEGVAEDPVQAEQWLNKAKAGGHKDAANSLLVLQQRQARKQDIAFYVTGYKGEEFSLAKHGCITPQFPEISRTQEEIKAVQVQMVEWDSCYTQFGNALSAAQPPGKLIPASVSNVMSVGELQQARSTMDNAYARVASEAEQNARDVMAAHDAWFERTKKWTLAMNKRTQDYLMARSKEINELNERRRAMMSNPSMNGGRR